MTLQECYTALGGDYDEALGRLRSEALIQKFLLKFLDDPSYSLLETSMACENWAEAFRGAHTIKGVCQNLSLTALAHSSAQLCDALRDGFHPEALPLAVQVQQDYQQTTAAIRAFQSSLPA